MKHAWKSMLGLTAAATLLYSTALTTNFAAAGSMEDLIAAAKKEGSLTTIALPHDWCGYGAVIDGFKAKYGLEVIIMTPPASVNTAFQLCSLTDWSIRHISDIFECTTDEDSLAAVEATFIRNVAATINGTPMSRSVLAQRVLTLRQSSKSGLRVVWRRPGP